MVQNFEYPSKDDLLKTLKILRVAKVSKETDMCNSRNDQQSTSDEQDNAFVKLTEGGETPIVYVISSKKPSFVADNLSIVKRRGMRPEDFIFARYEA